jgi:hypothetical protein
MIRWLLGDKDYPHINISPAPSTDKFHVIMYDKMKTGQTM